MKKFKDILTKTRGNELTLPWRLLCIDPGHTTGWCVFQDGQLVECGQVDTVINRTGHNEGVIDWQALSDLISMDHSMVVCEDYRVYAHKLERHTNSKILTLRIIGAIEYLCWKQNIPIYYQMAAVAKGFCSDKKLQMWDLWQVGQRHSRDAIRHGVYFLLFNKEISNEDKSKK